jgi:hypothetical protein
MPHDERTIAMTLLDRRTENADAIFEAFDFGYQAEDADGWSYDGDNEMTKVVYFEDEAAKANGDHDAPTVKGHLTLRFSNRASVEPTEVYAMLNGEIIGNLPGPLSSYLRERDNPAPAPAP